MKGITPVVAVILLLLVTIAVVGFAFGFFQRILGSAGTGVESQQSTVIDRTAQTVSIDNVDTANKKVTVRNSGIKDIKATAGADSELTVFVGAAKATCAWDAATVAPKTTTTCTWSVPAGACAANTAIKVVAPGNEATNKC